MLLDMKFLREILIITSTILRDNFFYDTSALKRFLNVLELRMMNEYVDFYETCEEDFKLELTNNFLTRTYFTSHFAGEQLRECFLEDLHFNDYEIELFQGILSNQIGAYRNDSKSSKQGTDNRELFERL